jgi:SAM-dependent methyltransferase
MGYARCQDCSFIFASPTLDPSLEAATYNDAKAGQSESKQSWMSDLNAGSLYQTHHKWVDLNPFVLGLGFHFQRYQKPCNVGMSRLRLLDIGCGYGHTLELARVFGLDGTGCDLDRSRVAACREKGLRVVDPGEVQGQFEIIISCNVIEHVYDLRGYIGMVSRCLADVGVFVFNGVERSVFAVEVKQRRFKLLHPIEHRNVLTRRSLSKLLGQYNLRLVNRAEVLRTMKRVRSKAPLYVPYLVTGGFVTVHGVFSAIARRAN